MRLDKPIDSKPNEILVDDACARRADWFQSNKLLLFEHYIFKESLNVSKEQWN